MNKLGKYEILEEIGRGGFATVYKARDTTLDRIVALKVLHSHVADDPGFIQRFYQEARTAARLRHPHIATVYEVGEEAGQHYLAMTFLPGQTLDAILESTGEPLALEQTVSIVEQIAGALDYIHSRGLVHRDVKPSNIIVDDSGEATLLDFGIVRAADGTQLTTTGAVMGTPQYMSPEQAEGEVVDHRSDVYSLGVVVYQMCTGQAPFDAVSPLVVLRLHADKAPPAPRTLNPKLPVELERVLLKALAKRRDARYQSAGELAGDLRGALEAEARALQREPKQHEALTSDRTIWEMDHKEMVRIPAGKFWMGTDRWALELAGVEWDDDLMKKETPSHEVHLPAYAIGRTPVTNAEYARFVEDEGYQNPDWWMEAGWMWKEREFVTRPSYWRDSRFNGSSQPVVGVTWYEALAYCTWLTAETGRPYRLPTEAEWEKAARGTDGRIWPWGNSWDADRCNTKETSPGRPTPVGHYSPRGDSLYGCADMAGNVWEWTSSLLQPYPYRPEDGREDLSASGRRSLRGGSWDFSQGFARVSARDGRRAVSSNDLIGFRVVVSLAGSDF